MTAIDVPEPAFMDDPELRIFENAADRLFRREASPARSASWRENGQVDRAFWEICGVNGLLGVSIPTEYGGGGGDFRHDMVLNNLLGRHALDGFALTLHNAIVLPYVLAHGTEAQKLEWLPRLCTGELISAIAMSEPGAGSDLQAIRTRAVKCEGGYLISGSKTYISNGQIANFIVVVAKTDPTQGARGTSLFLLATDGADGFRRGRKLDKIGLDAQDTSELFFDDVFVSDDALLGMKEGQGFRQLMAELPRERLMIALSGVSTMERAIDTTVEYTKTRQIFGQSVFDFQNTQFKLAEMKAKATVAKIFVNDCAARALAGTLDNTTAAIAKMWVTETEWQIVDECLQLHGGAGYINDYPIAQMFRNSRIQRILGGSTEVMKTLIARSL